MNLFDTNVLLYAMDANSPHHQPSREAIESALTGPQGVAFAWLAVVGFLRLSTKKGILAAPLSVEQALGVLDEWLAHPNARLLHPGERHADLLARLLLSVGTGGNLTNDAHLAALAIEHGAKMVSYDNDFKRFSGLQFQLLS